MIDAVHVVEIASNAGALSKAIATLCNCRPVIKRKFQYWPLGLKISRWGACGWRLIKEMVRANARAVTIDQDWDVAKNFTPWESCSRTFAS